MTSAVPNLRTRPLLCVSMAVEAPCTVGGPPGAGRRIGIISGGSFEGDRLRGIVLPGGADWQTERGDGATLLDARVVLETDDGVHIGMTYTGIRHGPADVMAALARGEAADHSAYYFRIVPSFATSDVRYEWLNRIVAAGAGIRMPEGPTYRIEEIV